MSGRLVLALPALMVTILGLALAVAARWIGWVEMAIAMAAIFAVGLAADQAGRRLLPARPRAAVVAFTVWGLSPGIAAAGAIAITLYFNAVFDPAATGAAGVDAEMTKTFVGALSAFLAATFIKVMDDADEAVIGRHVQDAFFARFVSTRREVGPDCYPVTPGQSLVEPWVFDDPVDGIEGWGWRARWARAGKVAEAMKAPEEAARVTAYREARAVAAAAPAAEADAADEADEEVAPPAAGPQER